MGFWDWVDPAGAARQKEIAGVQPQQSGGNTISKEGGGVTIPRATAGQQLPRNATKPEGGTRYLAATTPGGRVHTQQIVKEKMEGSPLADISRDVLEQKSYAKDIDSPDFVHAPTMERAYNVDKTEPGWGMKGYGGKIVSGLIGGIAPVIAGGLMGGKKGAYQAWQNNVQNRQEKELQAQKQVFDVSSDKLMREAYEMARMNYEADYNNGKTDLPFGDYLGQAIEAIGTQYSGSLGTLIDLYGADEGYKRYAALRAKSGGGGRGGSGGLVTITEYDPVTGQKRVGKVPISSVPDFGAGTGQTTTTTSPKGITVKSGMRPPLSSFNR